MTKATTNPITRLVAAILPKPPAIAPTAAPTSTPCQCPGEPQP